MPSLDNVLRQPEGIISRQARSFQAGTVLSPSVGNLPHLQLLNPAASTSVVVINRLLVRMTTGDFLELRSHASALTTLETRLYNRLIGGASPSAEFRSQLNATAIGTDLITFLSGASDRYIDLVIKNPIVLTPGNGVIVGTLSAANIQFAAIFDWTEADA